MRGNLMELEYLTRGIPPGRVAGGVPFRGAMQGLGKAASLGGWGLAGLGIAMGAMDELNKDPGNTIGNLAGAGGSLAGGVGGGLLGGAGAGLAGAALGLKGGPLAPFTVPLGFALGSMAGGAIGGSGARGVADFAQGVMNDPLSRQIRDNERLARSVIGLENEAFASRVPQMQALEAMQRESQARNTAMALQARAQQLYQDRMLGGSTVPVGAYMDPSFSAALANIGMRALG